MNEMILNMYVVAVQSGRMNIEFVPNMYKTKVSEAIGVGSQLKSFADFATDDGILTGDKLKLDDILGKEIAIKGYKVSESKYNKGDNKKVLTLQFDLDGVEYILFTGSGVLIDQTEKYKDEIPFLTKIEKVNTFYSYS